MDSNESSTNLLENTLSQNAFWLVNKSLAKALESIEAAALLADLIAKRKYFRDRGQLDAEGGFFNIADYIEDGLCLTEGRRRKLTKLLQSKGLIRVEKKGMPSRNYYYIQDDAAVVLLSQSLGNTDHKFYGKVHHKSCRKRDTNKNRALAKKKEQEPVPAPVIPSEAPDDSSVKLRSSEWIKKLERLINLSGVPERTKAMLQRWVMNEKRFGTGPSQGKLRTTEKIEAQLTSQQRRDLLDDEELEELDAQDDLIGLMVQLKSVDPLVLKPAFELRYGRKRMEVLTRKDSFEDVVEIFRATTLVQHGRSNTEEYSQIPMPSDLAASS